MIYQKYKTTLCRHYEETQTCSLGHLCSFAHSKGELRNINDVSLNNLLTKYFNSPCPETLLVKRARSELYTATTGPRCAGTGSKQVSVIALT
jgi:hypothetical protein